MSLMETIKPAISDSFRYPHPFRDMTVQGSDDGVNQVSEKITELTGITNEMLKNDGVSPDIAREAFKKFIHGFILVGHNVWNFDFKFLESSAYDHDWYMNHFVDTAAHCKSSKLANSERLFNETYEEWVANVMETKAFGVKFNVGLMCDELGIDKSIGQHRAMNDVLLTNEIYKKVCLS
jgi:DNA polymerase III epsilon subunit-like protein